MTAVLQELGHALGFEHDEDGVRAQALATGTRWSPTPGYAATEPASHPSDGYAAAVSLILLRERAK